MIRVIWLLASTMDVLGAIYTERILVVEGKGEGNIWLEGLLGFGTIGQEDRRCYECIRADVMGLLVFLYLSFYKKRVVR